jgi:hypothetical protein
MQLPDAIGNEKAHEWLSGTNGCADLVKMPLSPFEIGSQ